MGREEAWATADGVVLVVVLVWGACLNLGGLMRVIGRWSILFLLTRSGLGERKPWCRKNNVYLLIDRIAECSTSHIASYS